MSSDSFQDTLFEDPIGLRFRNAREKSRRTLESAAQHLKLPVAVLDAIEREDWTRLGAPIFVRSYVGSYARFLDLPASLADDVVRGRPTPQLSTIGSSMQAVPGLERSLTKLGYLVMTVVIIGSVVMLAMYFQSPRRSAQSLPLDPARYVRSGEVASPSADANTVPVMASLALNLQEVANVLPDALPSIATPSIATPSGSASAEPDSVAASNILMRFRGSSWVEIIDRNGTVLERGVVPSGVERRFPARQLGRVTIGNANVVEVTRSGIALDLNPYREADVARFAVSFAGAIVAESRR